MKLGTCKLGEIAKVGLGFKSLQNDFFYVSKKVVTEFGIEKRFLRPIYQLGDLESNKYSQTSKPVQWVFYCKEREQDLRGTGALRYIRAMERQPAKEKKQTGKHQTIKDALEAQGGGGGIWYMPKAQLHEMHIWLRKAFNTIYSPFIFDPARVVDQRCNFVLPSDGIDWKVIAAVLTSSLFSLSAESFGSASMGAGALELPTKKLHDLRVVDVRDIKDASAVKELLSMADKIWTETRPIDWASMKPTNQMQELDRWLLSQMGNSVTVERLYSDLAKTLDERLAVAEDRNVQTKQNIRVDIRMVALGVADTARPTLESISFPESFANPGALTETIDLPSTGRLAIECHPLMDQTMLSVRSGQERILLERQYSRSVAQVIIKALLLGRRKFSFPNDEAEAEVALKGFSIWFPKVVDKIQTGCAMSAVGSRYESRVHDAVLEALHLDPNILLPEFYGHLQLQN